MSGLRPAVRASKLALSLLPILLLTLAACNRESGAAGPGAFAMQVKVEKLQLKTVDDSSEYVSTLKSRTSATLQPQVEGQIRKIFVKSGDHVRAGQQILQIDPLKQAATVNSQEATRKSREANLEWTRVQLDRTRKLYEAGVASKQELDQAQTAYDAASADVNSLQAQVREQQVQLQYYSVDAPADGIVGDIPVHVGDRVTTSTVLTTIDSKTGLEVYINVPTERAPQVKLGMPVEVSDGAGKLITHTHITFISPQVDSATQSVLVKAAVDVRPDLRADQFLRSRIIWSSRPGVVIPVTAVSRISGQYFVYVPTQTDKGKVARQKAVQIGQMVGNDYVVMQGLQAGDEVIVSGVQNLADGVPIAPQS